MIHTLLSVPEKNYKPSRGGLDLQSLYIRGDEELLLALVSRQELLGRCECSCDECNGACGDGDGLEVWLEGHDCSLG